jgi:chemotaxis protein MotB
MADNNSDQIIIKKIKKVSGGHHGGAWKVAYADFVTAMMAFFLLMWLLSVTSPEARSGLADYFTPTTGLKDAKGVGVKGGLSPNEQGRSKSVLTDPGIVVGRVPQGPDPTAPTEKLKDTPDDIQTGKDVEPTTSSVENAELDKQDHTGDMGSEDGDSEEFKRVEKDMMNAFEQSPELKEFKNNIVITHTPEGLKIDMVDSEDKPMFAPGSALMSEAGKQVMKAVADIVATTTNKVSISGHTDAGAFASTDTYTNWELSADRANASRRYLGTMGVERGRFAKIQGMADRDLLLQNEPTSPRNRRISLTLMRDEHVQEADIKPTSRGLLSLPEVVKSPDATDVLPEAAPAAAPVVKPAP